MLSYDPFDFGRKIYSCELTVKNERWYVAKPAAKICFPATDYPTGCDEYQPTELISKFANPEFSVSKNLPTENFFVSERKEFRDIFYVWESFWCNHWNKTFTGHKYISENIETCIVINTLIKIYKSCKSLYNFGR